MRKLDESQKENCRDEQVSPLLTTILAVMSDGFKNPQGTGSEGRILALDFGARKIGLAVTDPLGITAQGLNTMFRKNKRTDLAALDAVIQEYNVRELVIGLPLRMSGAEGNQSAKARDFALLLEKHFGLPIHMWDERLTSVEANRVLRETEMSISKRAAVVDQLAAVLILQNFLEARSSIHSTYDGFEDAPK